MCRATTSARASTSARSISRRPTCASASTTGAASSTASPARSRSSSRRSSRRCSPATAAALASLNTPVRTKVTLPDVVTIGATWQATPQLALLATVEWTDWSLFQSVNITPTNPALPGTVIQENWRNTWFFSVGANYRIMDRLMLQGGVGYDESPVTPANRTTRIPDSNRVLLSVGAQYDVLPNVTLQVAVFARLLRQRPHQQRGLAHLGHHDRRILDQRRQREPGRQDQVLNGNPIWTRINRHGRPPGRAGAAHGRRRPTMTDRHGYDIRPLVSGQRPSPFRPGRVCRFGSTLCCGRCVNPVALASSVAGQRRTSEQGWTTAPPGGAGGASEQGLGRRGCVELGGQSIPNRHGPPPAR